MTEDRQQRTEVGSQRSEDRGRKSEVRSQRSAGTQLESANFQPYALCSMLRTGIRDD